MDMLGFPENRKRNPVTGLAEGREGDVTIDLAAGIRYEYLKGRWVKSLVTNMVTVAQQLVYASDGDTNGLNYFLGTNYGSQVWANPFAASTMVGNLLTNVNSGVIMSVSGYLTGQTDPPGITDRDALATSHVHVMNSPHTVTWDFTAAMSLAVSYWNLKNRDNSNDGATSVACEGSQDGAAWTLLNLNAARSATANVWAGGAVTDSTAWRYVRIRKTVDTDYFTIGEIELYGTFNYVPK